jgi:transcriptional regulator with XRE-family HTH domain
MQEMTTVSEPVINFGQLLRIKRESLGLGLGETITRSKISQLSRYEKGHKFPSKSILSQIMAFYKLSESDLDACKDKVIVTKAKAVKEKALNQDKGRIETIYYLIDSVLKDVNKMDDNGYLASILKKTAIDNLTEAKGCLSDLIIIDRLI